MVRLGGLIGADAECTGLDQDLLHAVHRQFVALSSLSISYIAVLIAGGTLSLN